MAAERHTSIDGNIAMIAGQGLLPKELADEMRNQGVEPFLIGINGEFDSWLTDFDHELFEWGQLGRLFKVLKKNEIRNMLFAGSITRPKISVKTMDWGAIRSLPEILAFMIGGDNSLLSGVIRMFEKHGIRIIGPHEIKPALLADAGAISGRKPSRKAFLNIRKAYEACKTLGELDIGQAAVAVGGRVVAVEGIEGTDGMLERVADMRKSGRLFEDGREGVLVKTMKPDQEMRVDLPAMGPETVSRAYKAGLRGIAVEAGHSIILSRKETLGAAKKADLFVYGIQSKTDGSIA